MALGPSDVRTTDATALAERKREILVCVCVYVPFLVCTQHNGHTHTHTRARARALFLCETCGCAVWVLCVVRTCACVRVCVWVRVGGCVRVWCVCVCVVCGGVRAHPHTSSYVRLLRFVTGLALCARVEHENGSLHVAVVVSVRRVK